MLMKTRNSPYSYYLVTDQIRAQVAPIDITIDGLDEYEEEIVYVGGGIHEEL